METAPLPILEGRTAERTAVIIQAAAAGATVRQAARAADCSVGTAHASIAHHGEYVEQRRREHAVNVLERIDPATDARLTDASNPESRTGPQSYRALLESIAWIGKNGDTHIHGDVNVGSIDARSINLDSSDADALAAKRAALGL